ncbi:predicted gamma-glutamyltranspeptidase (plasmid) [Sinorhizobium fredii NGR234]|uniref:Predicted gamma-glutamyltranspeptidase n=1 Tax=Sinorhizobium fredii (strain NBRC 101917 / NGR234) TaxID=394 RepID=C3KMT3_SINFN|nr:gamma-glutamyltransferase family protein [Sinorhizobium fredii]ACP21506.1 predicted gamma-glutamyltranspeptidase [Sinorhizobium fredii NGR234]
MRNFEDPGRSLAVARHGMAATSHPAATLTAIEVLKAGGNAVDAAVAAVAVQSVVEAGSTGVGGDCFAMIALEGSTDIRAYNGSGRAPAGLTGEALRAEGVEAIERSTPHAVTVPGAVDAWCRLLRDFGRMPIAEVLQPAIAMAREGYVLTPRVAADLGLQRDLLAGDPTARATFLVEGEAPPVGSIQHQPLLADTLDAIAHEGRDAFYGGAVAADMVDYLRGLGGRHSLEDFGSAQGDYVTPISTTYRGRTVYECPPNGQGVVALLILNILARFSLSKDPFAIDDLHVLLEATRLAYAARDAMVADPTGSDKAVEHMLSSTLADRLVSAISVDRIAEPLPSFDTVEHKDTVYLCVVDRDRNAVSFINSIFSAYGSGLMAPRSGVLFHNRGQSFSLVAGHPNEVGPRKRPMHTIIPGMVAEAGRVVMPFGVMGGHYQAMGHAHLLSRLYDCGLDLQTAIDLPRLFPLPATATVEAEAAIRTRLGAELERRGFKIESPRIAIGGAQAIRIDWERGVLIGASDPRKDGMALGY